MMDRRSSPSPGEPAVSTSSGRVASIARNASSATATSADPEGMAPSPAVTGSPQPVAVPESLPAAAGEVIADRVGESPSAALQVQREALLRHFDHFEKNFRKEYFPLWLGTLIGPWIAAAAALAIVYALRGPEYSAALITAATAAFVFAGRFIIIMEGLSGEWGQLLTPEDMFWMVTFQDAMVALFMAFHVGFLFKLPKIGPKIAELTVDGELILSLQPWMKRLTFVGLVAFIAFPLAATGSVGGAVFGRLLGLSRWATFWGSVIGSVLGNAGMWYLQKEVNRYLPSDSWAVQWGGLLIVVGIIVFLERRYSAMKREFIKALEADANRQPAVRPESQGK